MAAPFSMRRSTAAAWFLRIALCSGVSPCAKGNRRLKYREDGRRRCVRERRRACVRMRAQGLVMVGQ
jgi:hypothetical protein